MGIREKLNEKPALAVGIMAGAVLVAVLILYWQFAGNADGAPTRAFYTDDEGATYFVDAVDKSVPFDRNGRTAYRAWVFQCDDEEPFVAFIGRDSPRGQLGLDDDFDFRVMEIRRVGSDAESWSHLDGLVQERLFSTVPCPSGGVARQVLP